MPFHARYDEREDGCWVWNSARNQYGYGVKWDSVYKKTELAHRFAYRQAHGLGLDDINGEVVRHECDNPPCVNPDHLTIGTQQDNLADMHARKRGSNGQSEYRRYK
jgi:hypothetical protein